ncbi:MAG: hypothetical protein ACLRSD_02075 [Oscillibacter sp.]
MHYIRPISLGRLFLSDGRDSTLHRAGWSVNRSIKDSYFNSAASLRGVYLAKLFLMSNYHLKKLRRDKPGLGQSLET